MGTRGTADLRVNEKVLKKKLVRRAMKTFSRSTGTLSSEATWSTIANIIIINLNQKMNRKIRNFKQSR